MVERDNDIHPDTIYAMMTPVYKLYGEGLYQSHANLYPEKYGLQWDKLSSTMKIHWVKTAVQFIETLGLEI